MSNKTSAEFEIEVSGKKYVFVKVPASELSLDDAFMKHEPKTTEELLFKERIEFVIRKGIKNFFCAKYEPSVNEDGIGICYNIGAIPAEDKSYSWWAENAKKFCPERNSRLGTRYEYIAFLAVLIKKLMANGWSVENAWYAVCNDSRELGHYRNSKNARCFFEKTDSREIYGFFGLANTYKILAKDKEYFDRYWLASGSYWDFSNFKPLANMEHFSSATFPHRSVGWVVIEENSIDT